MIVAYVHKKLIEIQEEMTEIESILKQAVWIDLSSPTQKEIDKIQAILDIRLPTREEMVEIELSSRLYKENQTLFMTASMIANSNSPNPLVDPVTFILTKKQLITLRYIEPHAFKLFTTRLAKIETNTSAIFLLTELLDSTVERLADILEVVGHRLDEFSRKIFRVQNENTRIQDYSPLMLKIGADGDLNAKARESLIMFNRIIRFVGQAIELAENEKECARLEMLIKDIDALSDHSTFLSNKISFLLDAILGMISLEQNNIIKILSVAAVIFLPPTLIASIYGMNFHVMPGLASKWGFLIALFFIIISSWLPYKYFKYRKWL
jgi:magnesium transporter